MNKSTKAVLLSALAFPGAGHWYLGKRRQSVVLMLAMSAALFVLMSSAWRQANLIAEKVLSGETQAEIGAILSQMAETRSADSSSSITIATAILGIVWVVGVIGSWLAARHIPPKE
ncbi:MAG: hypothetical protein AB8B87_01680 [Granulosicoccus sp.]